MTVLEETAREEPFLTATEEMEKKLEETLSLIEGAGRVRVMITWMCSSTSSLFSVSNGFI